MEAKESHPYQIIISEALLQRTKAETVSQFYKQFIKDFPNWRALASAEIIIIILEEYLKPVGLYRQRAKRLKSLGAEMVPRRGNIPKDRQDLESIPFMGQYIANAVELIIHKKASPLIDVNMARVLERFFGERNKVDIRYDTYLQALAHTIVDHPQAKEINWAILNFAALICKARNPLCQTCILRKNCLYFNNLNV